jgi:hypothetical protein
VTVGRTFEMPYWALTPNLTGSFWHEFAGEVPSTFTYGSYVDNVSVPASARSGKSSSDWSCSRPRTSTGPVSSAPTTARAATFTAPPSPRACAISSHKVGVMNRSISSLCKGAWPRGCPAIVIHNGAPARYGVGGSSNRVIASASGLSSVETWIVPRR